MTNPDIPPEAVIVEVLARHAEVDGSTVQLTNKDQGLLGMIPVYASKKDAQAVHGKDVICRGISQHRWESKE